MSDYKTSMAFALRGELQNAIGGIRPPTYRSTVRVVYPYLVWPETAKDFPACCLEPRASRLVEEKCAMGREEREFVFRLIGYGRDSLRDQALEQIETLAADLERALAACLPAARASLKRETEADLVVWRGPDWQRLEANWRKPYAIALGLITARVRYDYGNP